MVWYHWATHLIIRPRASFCSDDDLTGCFSVTYCIAFQLSVVYRRQTVQTCQVHCVRRWRHCRTGLCYLNTRWMSSVPRDALLWYAPSYIPWRGEVSICSFIQGDLVGAEERWLGGCGGMVTWWVQRKGDLVGAEEWWLGGCGGMVTWWVRRNGGLVGAEEWWLGYCLAWSIMSGTISLLHSKVRPVFVVRSD